MRTARIVRVPIAIACLCAGFLALDVVAGIGYAAFAPAARAPVRDVRAETVLVLGDSLASGFRATPGNGWFDLLRARLHARDPRAVVLDLAVPGSRVRDLYRQLRRAPKSGVKVVFVVAGGNDLMDVTDPFSFAQGENSLMRAIRARYPAARVVVANVPDMSGRTFHLGGADRARPLPPPLRVGLALFTDVENAIVDRTVARAGDELLDLHALTLSGSAKAPGIAKLSAAEFAATYVSFDGLHPSDRGYALLADFAWPVLARAMDVRP